MWNSYLEKAKTFAESIDKQINDSVGIVEDPTATTTPSQASAAVVAELNDVWNDDFDHDDFEPEPRVLHKVESSQPPKEEPESLAGVTLHQTKEEEPAKSPVVESPAVEEPPPSPPQPPQPPQPKNDESIPEVAASSPTKQHVEPPPEETTPPSPEVLPVKDSTTPPESTPPSLPTIPQDATPPPEQDSLPSSTLKEETQQLFVETNDQHFPSLAPVEQQEVNVTEPGEIAPPETTVESPIAETPQEEAVQDSAKQVEESPILQIQEDKSVETDTDNEQAQGTLVLEDIADKEEAPMTEPIVDSPPKSSPTNEEPPVQKMPQPVQTLKNNHDEMLQLQEQHELAMAMLRSQVDDLQSRLQQQQPQKVDGNSNHDLSNRVQELEIQLQQRQDQLASKSEQLTTMQSLVESEKEQLRHKVRDTKEQAKKRILRAKERVEEMEQRLAAIQSSASESGGAQEEIIAALRQEGETLARKQSEMEKAVRSAKGETRELTARLQQEEHEKQVALETIQSLETKLAATQQELQLAQTANTRVAKLETELGSVKEMSEKRAATNLTLEQQVKELKSQNKDMSQELQHAKQGAKLETARTSELIKKEHAEILTDLEQKLRTSEREANVREDALRHEVTEIRKRWQDAVRRADALSMDVQNSTAPLMRQLESTERQNRVRAAAWAELETKLRSDLEEHVVENENLIKERNELRVNHNRLQRNVKEMENELKATKTDIETKDTRVQQLQNKLSEMETEGQKQKEEWVEVERLANEGVAKVRSDMMKTVVESEERYRAQVDSIEKELGDEREKRIGFERQLAELLESAGMASSSTMNNLKGGSTFTPASEVCQKKLKAATGQAEILASTLSGIGSFDDDDDSMNNDEDLEEQPGSSLAFGGGFAAMEQLTQRLKGSTLELEALRMELAESEKTRESLVTELGETRQASEKLPLFEAKVAELTQQNREMELEIMGLQDDIAEVRHLYRTQLDSLLEEKAAAPPNQQQDKEPTEMNGDQGEPAPENEPESETATNTGEQDG